MVFDYFIFLSGKCDGKAVKIQATVNGITTGDIIYWVLA